jgi:hypothetical protein
MVATRQLSSVVVLVAASFSGVDTAPIASPPSAGRRIPAHAGAESGHASEVAYEVGVVYTYDYSMDLESVRASCGAGGGVTLGVSLRLYPSASLRIPPPPRRPLPPLQPPAARTRLNTAPRVSCAVWLLGHRAPRCRP